MQEVPTLWSTALLLLLDHDLGVLPVPLPLAPWSHRRKRSPWRWSRGHLGERPPSFHLFLPARVLSWGRVVRFRGGGGWRIPEDGNKSNCLLKIMTWLYQYLGSCLVRAGLTSCGQTNSSSSSSEYSYSSS